MNTIALISLFFGCYIYFVLIHISLPKNAEKYKDDEEVNLFKEKSFLPMLAIGTFLLVFGIYFTEDWARIFGIVITTALNIVLGMRKIKI